MKKVLSFVLVLSLVLSSFSMAFAADTVASSLTDIAGIANEDAIQVNYDLGIVTGNPDGTFLPTKEVNRAEFAAMLTRALDIPDSALAGYTTTSFKDTTGYTWAVPYLAFCQSKGILLGDGLGNVMPGRTVSVNEAMTMALRAIGYTSNSSLLVGAWPANYVSLAQNNDLYDDVATTTTVNKASAAQIIYNLLTVQKVSVNTDGTTDLLWVDGDDEDGDPLNLLNSNLGCESEEDIIMGYDFGYDDAIINITDDIGAFGTAYLNDDDEVVAFIRDDCTTLTGSVNDDGDFEVGDVTYEFGEDITSSGIIFQNTDYVATGVLLDAQEIQSFADGTSGITGADGSDDADLVTLNVDLSGKKIKDVYSVSAWAASDDFEADSDVQDEITEDHELNSNPFVEDDDDNIDLTSFELVGVASLNVIAEDDVVYVYNDEEGDIRKVAVGAETVEGTIDEINEDYDVITIGDKEYDVAYLGNDKAYDFDDNDVSGDGTFYLDAYGEIYDYDGTSTTDTYGVVKASTPADNYDNLKIKLYTSDDSDKTVYLNEEDPADIDWEDEDATYVSASNVSAGALIGYSLDSNGDIDAINNTVISSGSIIFKSTKLLGTKTIDPDCVVFTYSGTWDGVLDDAIGITDYDIADLGDIDAGDAVADGTHYAAYILNDDDDVVAMLISDTFADATDDDIYGVINSRKSATDDGGDNVYKYTGYIDGTAFSYKTDDNTGFSGFTSEMFGVYAITLDSDNLITEIKELDLDGLGDDGTLDGSDEGSSSLNEEVSYMIMESGDAEVVIALDNDNTVITTTEDTYTAADDAVVYKYDEVDGEFTVSKLSAIDEDDLVTLYDTKGEDIDGIATVVIYIEDYVD